MTVPVLPDADSTPGAIVPLAVGVLEFPIPSAKRCFNLGKALRKAIESYPEDLKVAIVGTGGLSHQVQGERCGFNNTPWDMEFLDRLVEDPEGLTKITIAEYAEKVAKHLKDAGFRVHYDDRNEKLQAKIRDAQMQKIPYMLIIGGKEAEAGTVSVRHRSKGDLGPRPLEQFSEDLKQDIDSRVIG